MDAIQQYTLDWISSQKRIIISHYKPEKDRCCQFCGKRGTSAWLEGDLEGFAVGSTCAKRLMEKMNNFVELKA